MYQMTLWNHRFTGNCFVSPRPPPQFFFYYFLTCLKEKTALTEPTNRIQYQYVIIAALYMIVFEVDIFETNLAE